MKLTVGESSQTQSFEILKDPRSSTSLADLQAQFDFLIRNRDKLSETHESIVEIREVRAQLKQMDKRAKTDSSLKAIATMSHQIDSSMTEVEKALYQTQNRSRQDPLNYPIRLNNKLGHVGQLSEMGSFPPTQQAIAVQKELTQAIDAQLEKWKAIKERDLPAFNRLVKELSVDAVKLAEPEIGN